VPICCPNGLDEVGCSAVVVGAWRNSGRSRKAVPIAITTMAKST